MGRPPRAREPIKRAALELFVEQGIHATGIREIARHAGCSEAALYRHWANKDALVAGLFHAHLGEVVDLLDAAIAGSSGLADRIHAACHAAFALYDREPLVFRFVLLVRYELAAHITPGMRMPQDVIAELFHEVEPDPHQTTLLAAAAMGTFLQVADHVIFGRLEAPLSGHADAVSRLVLRMIGAG
ncbi:MAG: TetR/AcrR family transcriptional regulator [Planctomycetota bacterium]